MLWDTLTDDQKERLGYASYVGWNHGGEYSEGSKSYWFSRSPDSKKEWINALESVFNELDKIAKGE